MSTYFINQQVILQINITNTYFLGQHSNTYKVLSDGNSLSYQKYVQVIHKLTKNSITSKVWVFIFIVI